MGLICGPQTFVLTYHTYGSNKSETFKFDGMSILDAVNRLIEMESGKVFIESFYTNG